MPNVTLGGLVGVVAVPTTSQVDYATKWGVGWTPGRVEDDPEVSEDLVATQTVWSASPTMPTAEIQYLYGSVKRFGAESFAEVGPFSGTARFIRITYTNGDDSLRWYGIAELDQRFYAGLGKHPNTTTNATTSPGGASGITNALLPSGEQSITAYGLDRLLRQALIRNAFYDTSGVNTIREIDRAIGFNARGIANRTANKLGGTYHFESNSSAAEFWSTRDIVEYLLRYHVLVDHDGFDVVSFGINDPDGVLRTWDRPSFEDYEIQDRTTGEILDLLLPRERMAGWYVEVDDAELGSDVFVRPFSYLRNPLVFDPGLPALPANSSVVGRLDFDGDHTATASVKLSELAMYEQCIARGRRMRACGTFSFADGTLQIGWPGAKTTTYNNGGSGTVGYAAAGLEEKRRRNAIARGADSLRDVFARFEIIDGWGNNAKVGGGLGSSGQIVPAFPNRNPAFPNVPLPRFDADLFVLPTIPLDQGVSYAGALNAINLSTAVGVERPPLVVWKRGDGRYQNIESAGLLGDNNRSSDDDVLDWSASVSVEYQSRGFRVDVAGRPQHVLAAGGAFTALAADVDAGQGDYTDDLLATLAVDGDFYCEGKYPSDAVVKQNVAAADGVKRVRVLTIRAGEGYRLDYLVPGTVVGVDDAGGLETSGGGYLQDDRSELERLARIAYEWYSKRRVSVSMASDNWSPDLKVGSLIDKVGTPLTEHSQTVEGVVTEFRFVEPYGAAAPDSARMLINTSAGELDPLRLGQAVPNAGQLPPKPVKPGRPFPDKPVPNHPFSPAVTRAIDRAFQ